VRAESLVHVTGQAIFVDQAADVSLFADAVLVEIGWFG
jgi:hypothetical protein